MTDGVMLSEKGYRKSYASKGDDATREAFRGMEL